MQRFLLLLLFVSSACIAKGQTLRRPVAAGYIGLGAYSLNHTDAFSFTANPAALAQLKNTAAGVYGERRFLLSELNNYTLATGVVTGNGNFGLKTSYAGFSDYNETQIGLAYARKLGSKADIGVKFNYNGIRISGGYGSATAISFEIGTVFHLTEKLHAGIHVNNPAGGKFGKAEQEKLPSVYTIGFGYDVSEKFFTGAEIQKEEDRPVNVNAGAQYKFLPQLLARGGVSTATSSAWLGIGLLLKSFRLDITSSYHPQLGITPGILLLFNFNTNEK